MEYKGVDDRFDCIRVTLPTLESVFAFYLVRLPDVLSTTCLNVFLVTRSLMMRQPRYLSSLITGFISKICWKVSLLFLFILFEHWYHDLWKLISWPDILHYSLTAFLISTQPFFVALAKIIVSSAKVRKGIFSAFLQILIPKPIFGSFARDCNCPAMYFRI